MNDFKNGAWLNHISPVTLYRVMVELDSGAKYSGVLMCCVTVVTWLGFIILLLAEYTTEVTMKSISATFRYDSIHNLS